MADFTLSVLRPEDLLCLDFRFVNLAPDAADRARLVRVAPGRPALIVVEFAPQHAAEEAYDEADDGAVVAPKPPPIPAVLCGSSRLVFELPDDVASIPLSLDALLDWRRLQPVLPANALADPPAAGARPSSVMPTLEQTAIEMPYGLLLAPDARGVWVHSTRAVTHDSRAELWHTRLGIRPGEGIDDARLPTVRAVAAIRTSTFSDFFGHDLGSTLRPDQRQAIALASSDFSLRIRRPGDDQGPTPGVSETPYVPPPLDVSKLMLSPLGGWLDASAAFPFPTESDDPFAPQVPELAGGLVGWRHVIAQGRDQHVETTERGFLFPFGHRAILATITERKFEPGPIGSPVAYLARRQFISVREPTRRYDELAGLYPHEGREMPLARVTITTLQTPALEGSTEPPFVPTVAGGRDFLFQVQAEDVDGGSVEFAIPMLFARQADTLDPDRLFALYRDLGVDRKTADLRGQALAVAPQCNGAATFKTFALTFDASPVGTAGFRSVVPFLPLMRSVVVDIPAISQLFGATTSAPTRSIAFLERYLEHGFRDGPQQNPGAAFARIPEFNLALPGDRGGGIASPAVRINGLSKTLGAIPAVDAIASGTFNPQTIFQSAEAKLLGAVDLSKLIASVTGATGQALAKQVPKLVQVRDGGVVRTTYEWHPPLKRINDPSAQHDPDAIQDKALALMTSRETSLDLKVETVIPFEPPSLPTPQPRVTGPESTTITGTLRSFGLNLLDIVEVRFAAVAFESVDGHKMTLRADGIAVEFKEALRFIRALASILPGNGFAKGASIDVTKDGITTGYSLPIPTASIGMLSIENIALSASLTLPFTSAPTRLRLAFSSREHPFLVTVSMIGGGGFFALALNTRGVERIEGAIELGGNITVDFLVVRANVHALAGFYFGIGPGDNGKTVFVFEAFLRVGGSVEVLGIVGVSVELYVGLHYSNADPEFIRGDADVTIGAHVFMFSKSITLSVSCKVNVTTGEFTTNRRLRGFEQVVSRDEWRAICDAYA